MKNKIKKLRQDVEKRIKYYQKLRDGLKGRSNNSRSKISTIISELKFVVEDLNSLIKKEEIINN